MFLHFTPATPDAQQARTHVREALREDAVEVLRGIIPPLRDMTPQQAYDAILDNPDLLDACFSLFRARPEHFAALLVDAAGQPEERPDVPLRCGRTLADVIAMIVRTSARRYFKREVAGGEKHGHSAAERLYRALHDHLLHEWQVRLIPAYSVLDPERAQAAGAKILELREPDDVRLFAETGRIAPGAAALAASRAAGRRAAPGLHAAGLREEDLWRPLQDARLDRLLDLGDATRRVVALASGTAPDVLDLLRNSLDLNPVQTTAFLCALAHRIGPVRYGLLCDQPSPVRVLATVEAVLRRERYGYAMAADEVARQAQEAAAAVARDLIA